MPVLTAPSTAVDFLKDLVRFPSLSGEEAAIADFVEATARAAGVPVGRHDDNVFFWLGDGPDTLLFNSHLDVVPPAEGHPYDPFEPTEVDGLLYGRGTVDAKASGAAMTTALLELAAEGWTPPGGRLLVALTTCEETGGPYNGLEDTRPHLPAIHAAVVGEPTDLQPCVAQKGLLILRVHAHGTAAHAARAHLGDNAIVKAARAIEALEALTFDRADPHLGAPTLAVTTIEGGRARNMVPDRCTFYVDLRSTPAYTHAELTALVREQVPNCTVMVHSERIVPVVTSETSRVVQAALRATPGSQPFGSPTASDWIFLQDVPTVKLGPGLSQRSHTADEHIAVQEVEQAVAVYKRLARAYFGMD